ncbi:hypothetical protein wcw_p0020 (plasmid) [Waddlia chondrophila WSU 86-1044]|uniref:Uncharacterized protein n=1 Tax=Waddlia chondrophila (strain ATCC VR-1470 / WSU 86-1044) TaxID=716544 RepID=D6YX25_WADCW|nr:hypothetical protein wcw_p0020 [Waddlia chondrophila WSU 86-1044]
MENSGLIGNDYGNLFVQGSSKNHPVSFDFFHTMHRIKNWTDNPHPHLERILKNYTNCSNTILLNWKIKQCSWSKIIVEGDYLDNSKVGYFQLFSEFEPTAFMYDDIKKPVFNLLIKIESEFMDEETLQFYYDSVKPLKKRLY